MYRTLLQFEVPTVLNTYPYYCDYPISSYAHSHLTVPQASPAGPCAVSTSSTLHNPGTQVPRYFMSYSKLLLFLQNGEYKVQKYPSNFLLPQRTTYPYTSILQSTRVTRYTRLSAAATRRERDNYYLHVRTVLQYTLLRTVHHTAAM